MPGKKPTLTTTSYAVLGLLALRDWTTYELAKQMQRSLHHVWPRAERKLYDEPKSLVAHGYAEATKEMVGSRPRTLYAITPAGRAALTEWLATPIAAPSLEFEGMLRVLFADHGNVADLRQSLVAVIEQATAARTQFAVMATEMLESAGGAFPQRRHVNALGMRFMIDHYDHLIAWGEWALTTIEAWDDTKMAADTWRVAAEDIFRDAAAFCPSAMTQR